MESLGLKVGDKIYATKNNYLRIKRDGDWVAFLGVKSVRASFKDIHRIANAIAWTHGLESHLESENKESATFILG